MNTREIRLNQAKAAYVAEISERTGQRIESGRAARVSPEVTSDARPALEHQPNRERLQKAASKTY